MLGNVHAAHDLEARDDGALQFGGDRKHAAQKTVDTHTHDHFAVLWLQVDITRALGKRAFNEAVDKADRRRLDELLLRDKAGVVYQEKCAIAINFFLKIVNNLQYFSPFRTYFTIHISFFLKFIVHFLPSADGSPVFLRKRFALSALFSIISGKPKKTHRFRRLFRKKTGILWVTRHTAAHAIFVERIDPI